ncbi:hypothetical protein R1flu_001555 [Riccia fluitans]|uniref:Uncharacterized protein n=1 Tax=Riccia fluitans TaxID=41844 RepID=A0ABD1Y427_9MARC
MLADFFGGVDEVWEEALKAIVNVDGVAQDGDTAGVVGGGDTTRMQEAELRATCKPLFHRARMNLLSFVMILLNICYEHNVSNVVVDEILALF